MTVLVNGRPWTCPTGTAVASVVAALGHTVGVAVAVNGTVVPRAGWERSELREGDRVEVLTAVQGG